MGSPEAAWTIGELSLQRGISNYFGVERSLFRKAARLFCAFGFPSGLSLPHRQSAVGGPST